MAPPNASEHAGAPTRGYVSGTARGRHLVRRLLIAAIVPFAAGIYLLTAAAWTVAERATLGRLLTHQSRS